MAMGIDLPVIWAVIIGFGLMMYVVMDGFDLGIGILFPFIRDRGDRDTMVNTVAPVWDGNETWLVLGGATLMAVWRHIASDRRMDGKSRCVSREARPDVFCWSKADRGPFVPGRDVDVSYSAAETLGMVGRGIAKVKLDVVQ
jgi:Cytochrome bd terminal oxidase subunit II